MVLDTGGVRTRGESAVFKHLTTMLSKLKSIGSTTSENKQETWHKPEVCPVCHSFYNKDLWVVNKSQPRSIEKCQDCGTPAWAWGRSIIDYDINRSNQRMMNWLHKEMVDSLKDTIALGTHFEHQERLEKLYKMIGWRPPKSASQITFGMNVPNFCVLNPDAVAET
jgi:hypothetical protein